MTFRILMVEDEIGFSSCYADWMRETDCIFDVAATVPEAIQRVHLFTYDMMLVDFHVKDMCGLDFIEAVRCLPNARCARFYAMTADSRPETIDQCKAAGFIDILIKPFRHSEFMETLEAEKLRLELFGAA